MTADEIDHEISRLTLDIARDMIRHGKVTGEPREIADALNLMKQLARHLGLYT